MVSGSGIALRRPGPSWEESRCAAERERAGWSAWGAGETRRPRGSGAGVPGPEFGAWPGTGVWGGTEVRDPEPGRGSGFKRGQAGPPASPRVWGGAGARARPEA